MTVIESYPTAVILTVITMLCWGSWANTQKLASKEWKFQLFYWDYVIGIFVFSLIFALTAGSMGESGRPFLADFSQASSSALGSALIGGIVFNLANILLVAAIDIAGMSVAFPVGIGLALVIGVVSNYVSTPVGNAALLFSGVGSVAAAIILAALSYRIMSSEQKTTVKGIVLSIAAGILMGFFYKFVADSISPGFINSTDLHNLEAGKLSPYTALVVFSAGVFFSSFIWNTFVMYKPFTGEKVSFGDYFKKGSIKLHAIGIVGGIIWSIGMNLNIIASGAAGPSISYGLGQGATLVAALWGVFIWKEFKGAPPKVNKFLAFMFAFYVIGLALIIVSRNA